MYYINNSGIKDPHTNLALEEYVVRNLDRRSSYVLFYINRPSLIIGKHQNVPEEVDLTAAHKLKIPIIRRISGGGCVYHDEGNLNFSYITRQTLKNFNQYSRFLEPVIAVLQNFGINVCKDRRNNLLIDGRKISGNAQFTSRGRLLCHGTLLFNTELEVLNEVLLMKKYDHIFSKSTKSHRSTVVNLSDYLAYPITLSDLKNSILDFMFKGNIQEYNLNEEDWKSVHQLATKKYKSWDWNLGLSPKSTIKLKIEDSTKSRIINLNLEHGKMSNFSISGFSLSKKLHHTLQELLIGRRFDVEDLREMVSKLEQVQFPQEITNVFRKALTH